MSTSPWSVTCSLRNANARCRTWYSERDAGAAKGFERELDAAIEAIADAPDRWPQWMHGTRRYLFRRYPFFVVYKVHDTAIWVVAIAHAKRRPDYCR